MTESTQHALEKRLGEAWPMHSWRDSHVVLAVSSGPDSVAMLRAVLNAKASCGGVGQVTVAHFNHCLRGAEAEEDLAWLDRLCCQLHVPLMIGRADATAIGAARGVGWEAAARNSRYRFLQETAERLGARFVAVAHTRDDQVETVLHRLLRGTGLGGLAGMPPGRQLSASVALVRPLLAVRKREVLEYLAAIGQEYRVDASNADTRWTRNRLRHELLPMLRERYNAGIDEALVRLATQAGEAQQVIATIAEQLAEDYVTRDSVAGLRIDCRRLAETPPLLAREVCRVAWGQAGWPMQAMGFEAWQQLAELIRGQRQSAVNLPGNIRGRRERDTLILEVLD
jgi:tRNA(Ile)-lysidine synthase